MPDTKALKKTSVNSKNEPRLFSELLHELSPPRRTTETVQVIARFTEEKNLSDLGASKLKKKALEEGLHKIRLKWPNTAAAVKLYSSVPDEQVNVLELATAFHPKSYICYLSALYWNELTEQVPRTFYVAQERPGSSSVPHAPEKFDDLILRDVFLKSPAKHRNVATFQGYRYVFLARAFTGHSGVESRTIPFQNRSIEISITNLERTLLDCVSVPENAGGISNVLEAFERGLSRMNNSTLLSLYRHLDFKYPHWQRIGLVLEKLDASKFSRCWKSEFGEPKNKFFIAKEYKLDWELDPVWKVYYPKGLFP